MSSSSNMNPGLTLLGPTEHHEPASEPLCKIITEVITLIIKPQNLKKALLAVAKPEITEFSPHAATVDATSTI